MKPVPVLIATLLAVYVCLSVSARQPGDTASIVTASAQNKNAEEDSLLAISYIYQSKTSVKPDSALILADAGLQFAIKAGISALITEASEQKNKVQTINAKRLRQQDEAFIQNKNQSYLNTNGWLIALVVLLSAGCIYLSVQYARKKYALRNFEKYRERLEEKNKELLQFQKDTLEKQAAEPEPAPEITTEQSEDLEKVNSIKERLIPMIAHDIRSPLASLQQMLSLTRENILSTEEFQKLSLSLEADIYNLRGMLDNMLLWTREQMIEIKVNKTGFNLSEVMQSVILMYRNSLINKNISICNYIHPELNVFSDREIITAVLRNVVSNAIKFTLPDKKIYFTAIFFRNKIFLSVRDEGNGIAPDVLEKINNNQHVTTQGTANEKGTGIGLLFTKDLLQKLEENFDITSFAAQGTSITFSMELIAAGA